MRAVVAHLDAFDVGKEVADVPGDLQLPRLQPRSGQMQIARRCRVSRDPPAQVGSQDRIHIQVAEMQVDIGRPVAAKVDRPIDVELAVLEFRKPVQSQFGPRVTASNL